jgi:carbamoylphosphate synthase small subunit
MRAIISTIDLDEASLLEKVKTAPEMKNGSLPRSVTTDKIMNFPPRAKNKFHVVCLDFGVKTNSLREFSKFGCG